MIILAQSERKQFRALFVKHEKESSSRRLSYEFCSRSRRIIEAHKRRRTEKAPGIQWTSKFLQTKRENRWKLNCQCMEFDASKQGRDSRARQWKFRCLHKHNAKTSFNSEPISFFHKNIEIITCAVWNRERFCLRARLRRILNTFFAFRGFASGRSRRKTIKMRCLFYASPLDCLDNDNLTGAALCLM